jgi:hypothetical protein
MVSSHVLTAIQLNLVIQELSTFFPYNLIAFSLIPPLLRPFTTGLLSMCFSIYISWVTHQQPSHALPVATGSGSEELFDDTASSPNFLVVPIDRIHSIVS